MGIDNLLFGQISPKTNFYYGKTVADLRGRWFKFFHYHAVFGKNNRLDLSNLRSWRSLGNPGSATEKESITNLILFFQVQLLFGGVLRLQVTTFLQKKALMITFSEPLMFLHPAGTSKDSDICDLSKVSDIVTLSWRSMRIIFLPLHLYHTEILFQ